MTKKIIIFSFLVLIFVVTGCRQKDIVTAFDNLPESHYLDEAKQSLESKHPVAIAFTASWCPHCRAYKPVFFAVEEEFKNKAAFINIDVDEEEGSVLSERFQVQGVPTTAFVRQDGSVFKIHVGELDENSLTDIIKGLLKSRKKAKGEPIAPFSIEPVMSNDKEEYTRLQELIPEKENEIEKINPAVDEKTTLPEEKDSDKKDEPAQESAE